MHDVTTLVTGPSGTEKELVARAIDTAFLDRLDRAPGKQA
jgi:transcriptional regulator with AAA-type ATPase domain